jgi:hypothetical protein
VSQTSFKPSSSRTQVAASALLSTFPFLGRTLLHVVRYLVMYGVREVSKEGEVACVLLAEDVGFLRYVTVSIGK